jgi:hypothetical protein
LAIIALPFLQKFGGLTWDEAVTAILVPVVLVYVMGRLCLRAISPEQQAEMEREHSKAKGEMKPIPADIGMALVFLIAVLVSELLLLPSTVIYGLLGLRFTSTVFRFDLGIARLALYVIAYIGAALCWRWCMPLLRYELYSLIMTIFDFPNVSHRRDGPLHRTL